jgi:hypothetical protein
MHLIEIPFGPPRPTPTPDQRYAEAKKADAGLREIIERERDVKPSKVSP